MDRIKIDLPEHFLYSTTIAVRITDLNYGGHVGNDTVLSIIHEARMQFLRHFGYSELNMAGAGMIMSDVAISFKNELYYEDVVSISVTAANISRVSFDLLYRLEKESKGKIMQVAHARTGMICYDYQKKKVISVPDEVRQKWSSISSSSLPPE